MLNLKYVKSEAGMLDNLTFRPHFLFSYFIDNF